MLHFDEQGALLRPPVRHPVLRAPQNPMNAVDAPPNLPSSRGFEAMRRNADGSRLYVTTEGGGNGRVPGTPDGTEIITLRSQVPLRTLRVQPCKDASLGTRNGQSATGNKCR